MKFNEYSVSKSYLKTHWENLPPFTLSPETTRTRRKKEKGRTVFKELDREIPVLQGPVNELRITLKALARDPSWVSVV